VQNISSLNANAVPLAAQLWENDIRTVHLHDLPDLIQTIKQDVVNLVPIDPDILNINLHAHNQLLKFMLGPSDLFLSLARDVDFILTSAVSIGRNIAEDAWERRWEVNGSASSSLDELDILAGPTAYQGVRGKVELDGVHVTFELFAVSGRRDQNGTAKKIENSQFDRS